MEASPRYEISNNSKLKLMYYLFSKTVCRQVLCVLTVNTLRVLDILDIQ